MLEFGNFKQRCGVFVLFRPAFILAWAAIFLQIAVFLQPLLPEKFQISPVCETIASALHLEQKSRHSMSSMDMSDMSMHHSAMSSTQHDHQQHDPSHECIYCTVYGHVVATLDFEIKQVLDRIQIRLLAFRQAFKHVYFVLQRLFLTPQGRAPPLFITPTVIN